MQANSPWSTIPAMPWSMILASDRGLSMCGRGCTVTADWS